MPRPQFRGENFREQLQNLEIREFSSTKISRYSGSWVELANYYHKYLHSINVQ